MCRNFCIIIIQLFHNVNWTGIRLYFHLGVAACLFFRISARAKRFTWKWSTWFSWEWTCGWHTLSYEYIVVSRRLVSPQRLKSTWNWRIYPWAGSGSLWSTWISANAKVHVVPRNRNSNIREFILGTAFADSQRNVISTAHVHHSISLWLPSELPKARTKLLLSRPCLLLRSV